MYQEIPLIMIKSQLYLKDNYVTISLLKKKDIFKKRFSIQFNTRKITQALFDSLPVFFLKIIILVHMEMVILSGTPCMLYFEGVMYLQFRSSHACKKRIFALRHVIFRPATGYDSRNSEDVQMVSSIAFTWFMKFVFAQSFCTLCFFTFYLFFFYFSRSIIIFHIYPDKFWNISIKCSAFKEKHFN